MKIIATSLFMAFSMLAFGQNTTMTDASGNTYSTVSIGQQIWTSQNIRAAKGKNGETLNYIADSNPNYGYLYDWNSACKVCAEGWHLPTKEDFNELITFYGGTKEAGDKMKAYDGIGVIKFSTENVFKAYPAGVGHPDTRKINFRSLQQWDTGRIYLWTQTEENSSSAWYVQILTNLNGAVMFSNGKAGYQSVRCIKDK